MNNKLWTDKNLVYLSILIHIIAAWFSVGFYHPDEHYQIIEFANYKLGGIPANELPWEFPAEMRPAFQPLMAYIIFKIAGLFTSDAYILAFILRLISGLASLFVAVQFNKTIAPAFKRRGLVKLHLALSVLGWGLVFSQVRFSSENWSGMCLALGVMYLLKNHKSKYLLFGIFAGLSFLLRFQSAFFLLGSGLYFLLVEKTAFRNIAVMLSAFFGIFVVGIIVDYWFYGAFTVSSWEYFYQNIFENKAAGFGVSPWYWYAVDILNFVGFPFSLLLLIATFGLLKYQPRHILTWSIWVFIIGHSLVAHKEFRFLFPLSYFVPFVVCAFFDYLYERYPQLATGSAWRKSMAVFAVIFWMVNSVLLLYISVLPANDQVAFNYLIHKNIKQPTAIIYSRHSPLLKEDTKAYFYEEEHVKGVYLYDYFKDTTLIKGRDVLFFTAESHLKDEAIFRSNFYKLDSTAVRLAYINYPLWLKHFDFNGWYDRSNFYKLYRTTR